MTTTDRGNPESEQVDIKLTSLARGGGCACKLSPADLESVLSMVSGLGDITDDRLLVGLSGADTTAQGLVDWQRREWLTNTPAWDNEYQAFLDLPESIRSKNFILMDELDQVVGLDSVQYFMDRYKPPWAKEEAGG